MQNLLSIGYISYKQAIGYSVGKAVGFKHEFAVSVIVESAFKRPTNATIGAVY